MSKLRGLEKRDVNGGGETNCSSDGIAERREHDPLPKPTNQPTKPTRENATERAQRDLCVGFAASSLRQNNGANLQDRNRRMK